MKNIIIASVLSLVSFGTFAQSCESLDKYAQNKGIQYGTKYSFIAKGSKGNRVYFHSAPANECKIKNLFIIPNDSVVAYQEYKNQNKTWLYVMFIAKDGTDTEGWIQENNLKVSGSVSPIQ